MERVHPKLARLRSLPFLLTGKPLTLPYFYSAALQAQIHQALFLHSYDRIFVYCSAMAQYVDSIDGIPVVMDFVDVDSDKWMQYAAVKRFPLSVVYRREGRALRAYERKLCEKASCIVVTTEREAQLVRQIEPAARVHVVPNGVDTSYFDPQTVPRVAGAPTAIFTGDMSYFPNEEAVIYFARSVFPLIRRSVAGARFLIVGRNPGPKVQKLRHIEGVEVTGFVPDVRTYLARAQVAVAPFMIAAGIQNKILEAMAYGLPVVATPRTAQGLSADVADMVEMGSTAEELASKIVLLLRDFPLARSRGMESRRRVADHYSWDCALEQLLQLLENPGTTEFPRPRTQSFLA